jgi:hypothetical protein
MSSVNIISPLEVAPLPENSPYMSDFSKEPVVLIFQLSPPPSPILDAGDQLQEKPFIFNTTWGTLLKDVSKLLTYPVDEHNRVYIGREPGMFSIILKYLETGELNIKNLSDEEKQRLKEDIIFFELKGMKRFSIDHGLLQWTDEENAKLSDSPSSYPKIPRRA